MMLTGTGSRMDAIRFRISYARAELVTLLMRESVDGFESCLCQFVKFGVRHQLRGKATTRLDLSQQRNSEPDAEFQSGACHQFSLNVEVLHVQRIIFDEPPPGFHRVAHENGKDAVGLNGIVD